MVCCGESCSIFTVIFLITGIQASLFMMSNKLKSKEEDGIVDTEHPNPLSPNLPARYYTQFTLYYTTQANVQPPWLTLPPILPTYSKGRGMTWYSWHNRKCIEYYLDICVPIFYPNSNFPCVMFNYNDIAYLMTEPKYRYGSCCVFKKPWLPPRRDFMKRFAEYYTGEVRFQNKSVDWWIIPSGSGGDNIPFGGYGWRADINKEKYREPVVFWYQGDVGWAQQIFYNFTDNGPEVEWIDKQFTLPPECYSASNCEYKP